MIDKNIKTKSKMAISALKVYKIDDVENNVSSKKQLMQ